jgi:ABC-2 type transport system ATP-binding protein
MKLVRSITKKHAPKKNVHLVLDNLSLKIEDGQILGLIGPNGAGKTTLVKVITGLLIPSAGEVLVNGYNPTVLSTNFKKSIALFRGSVNTLDDGVAIIDSINEKLAIYKQSDYASNNYVKEFVKHFEVEEFLDRTPDSLSLGQRMLMEYIYAVCHKASLVILDEPTNGLDVIALNKFKQSLIDLKTKYGVTIILTSHNLQNVLSVSDRIILINDGKILLDGTPNDVVRQANNVKIVRITTDQLPKSYQLPSSATFISPILELRVETENLNAVLKNILEKIEVQDIEIVEPPIEDIFAKYFQRNK